jgi:hypothetical protein
MLGDHIRLELGRPLEGDRHFVRVEQGDFTLRHHPEHIAVVMAERARLRVEEDLRNYRRMLTLRGNRVMLELTEVHDPFEDFWDPEDFPVTGTEWESQ